MRTILSRKDIAQITGVCTKTVKVKEVQWGLLQCRAKFGGERVFYSRQKAIKALQSAGLLPS